LSYKVGSVGIWGIGSEFDMMMSYNDIIMSYNVGIWVIRSDNDIYEL
jgi:hypothetical protein